MNTALDYLAAVRAQAEVVRKLGAVERVASDTYNRAFARWSGLSEALAAVVRYPDAYARVERLERDAAADLKSARAQFDRCSEDTLAARAELRALEYPALKDGATS